jgi:hypothetical protein
VAATEDHNRDAAPADPADIQRAMEDGEISFGEWLLHMEAWERSRQEEHDLEAAGDRAQMIAYAAASRVRGEPFSDELEDARRQAAREALDDAGVTPESLGWDEEAFRIAAVNGPAAWCFGDDMDREEAEACRGKAEKSFGAWRYHENQRVLALWHSKHSKRPTYRICDQRHRRASRGRPIRRRGSRRTCAPTRGDPDSDGDPEPPAPAPGEWWWASLGGETCIERLSERRLPLTEESSR